jgi:hypothetical protein
VFNLKLTLIFTTVMEPSHCEVNNSRTRTAIEIEFYHHVANTEARRNVGEECFSIKSVEGFLVDLWGTFIGFMDSALDFHCKACSPTKKLFSFELRKKKR